MRRTAETALLGLGLMVLPGLAHAQAEIVVRNGADRCEIVQALGGACGAPAQFGTAPAGQPLGLVIEPETPAAESPQPAAAPAPAPRPQPAAAPQPVAVPAAPAARPIAAAAFPAVEFAFDSAALLPGAAATLDTVAAALNDPSLGAARFVVEGHADASGEAGYNQALSELRARAVVDYLAARGVDPARLQWAGRGESDPSNPAAPHAPENRRVVLLNLGS